MDKLIHAFKETLQTHPDAVFVIVGDGPEKVKYGELANNYGISDKVLFAGRFEDVALYAWYLVAGCFALPSTFERFGAVINEALLAGVPTLCSSIEGA